MNRPVRAAAASARLAMLGTDAAKGVLTSVSPNVPRRSPAKSTVSKQAVRRVAVTPASKKKPARAPRKAKAKTPTRADPKDAPKAVPKSACKSVAPKGARKGTSNGATAVRVKKSPPETYTLGSNETNIAATRDLLNARMPILVRLCGSAAVGATGLTRGALVAAVVHSGRLYFRATFNDTLYPNAGGMSQELGHHLTTGGVPFRNTIDSYNNLRFDFSDRKLGDVLPLVVRHGDAVPLPETLAEACGPPVRGVPQELMSRARELTSIRTFSREKGGSAPFVVATRDAVLERHQRRPPKPGVPAPVCPITPAPDRYFVSHEGGRVYTVWHAHHLALMWLLVKPVKELGDLERMHLLDAWHHAVLIGNAGCTAAYEALVHNHGGLCLTYHERC